MRRRQDRIKIVERDFRAPDLSRKNFSERPDINLFCDRQIMLKSIGRKSVALVDVACLKSFPKPSNSLSGAAMGE